MDLPDKIKIGPFDYELILWDSQDASMTEQKFGKCCSNSQRIWVDGTMKPQKFLDTLIHEVNHAVYWVYGLEDADKEERIVSTTATAWVAIYRDNPWFLDLTKALLR